MEKGTRHVILRAMRKCSNGYTELAFENLDYIDEDDKYLVCSLMPNWDIQSPTIDMSGYLSYNIVKGGIDKYFDGSQGIFRTYMYDGTYVDKFIIDRVTNNLIV